MTKDFFKFINTYLEDAQADKDREEKHAKKSQNFRNRDEIERAFETSRDQALDNSKKGGNQCVYISLDDPTSFKVCCPNDGLNLDDSWLNLGYAQNGTWTGQNPNYSTVMDGMIYEKLSVRGRRALKRSAKRNKARLKLARKKAKRKTASYSTHSKRANRRARKQLAKHLTRGRGTSKMSNTQLNRIQAMVNARHGQLDALRRKLIPQVRKDDHRR